MKKKKQILFIPWSFSYGGGAEKQLAGIVNNLDKDKYEIDVLEFFHTNINIEPINSNINLLKPVNDKQKESRIKRFLVNILVYVCPAIIRKIYIKKEYDYEISFNQEIPTFLLSKNPKSKKICWIHGPIWNLSLKKHFIRHFIQKHNFKKADKIVAISEETLKSIKTIYPKFAFKTTKIYNGYDYKKMDELSEEYKVKKAKKFEILYANRFDENKNPLLLIEAARLLKEETNDFHINFLGKGMLESKMRALIKEYNLEENISIVGYKSNPYPYIKMCDIFCLTSVNEGFSNVIIEAVHFHKPFVSTNVGIVNEIKQFNVGKVASTPEEISYEIHNMLINNEQYNIMVKNCKKIENKFSIENQAENLGKVIEEL